MQDESAFMFEGHEALGAVTTMGAYIICISSAKASWFGNQCSRTGDYYSAFITIQSTLVQGRKKIGFWMFCSAPEDSANAAAPCTQTPVTSAFITVALIG
jgi:hypothetical protein